MSTSLRPQKESPRSDRRRSAKPRRGAKTGLARLGGGSSSANESTGWTWTDWQAHLAARDEPIPLTRLMPKGRVPPLLWNPPDDADPDTLELIGRLADAARGGKARAAIAPEEVENWLATVDGQPPRADFALACLAWCHALPRLAAALEEPLWIELVEFLLDVAQSAAAIDLRTEPLAQQLLAGELLVTLAWLFPELSRCRKGLVGGRKALSAGLIELLDGEGLPHANYLPLLRPLLACWTRAGYVGRQCEGGALDDAATTQYEWLVRQTLRMTRADGSQALSSSTAGQWSRDLLLSALELSDDEEDWNTAHRTLPGGTPHGDTMNDEDLPEPSLNSEWAGVSVLRPEWTFNSARLTVSQGTGELLTELSLGAQLAWSGSTDLEVTVDGKTLAPQSSWDQACWYTDEDVDYLELETQLGQGWTLTRQWVMGRKDRCLLAADTVAGPRAATIRYRHTWPLNETIRFAPAAETREGYLVSGPRDRRRALVLPLALGEWRCDGRGDALTTTAAGLELSQTARGQALYAPLWLDLEPRRFSTAATWRQLTVAEQLAIVPSDLAVGYRVQVGPRQWLVYRSLGPKGNRTLLGHNLATEFLVARFQRGKAAEPVVEIL